MAALVATQAQTEAVFAVQLCVCSQPPDGVYTFALVSL